MVLDAVKRTDKPSSKFMALFFAALRSESAKKAYNLIRTAEHFTGFSTICDITRYSVKQIDGEEEPTDDDLLAESPSTLRGGADKPLARPGRKQATATQLGIYSTYSPQSSVHFLARCSNFCKPLKKKNSEDCPSNQVTAAAMTSALDEKWRPFNCFFSPGNRW